MRNKFILSLFFALLVFFNPAQISIDSLEQSTENLTKDTVGLIYLERLSEKIKSQDQAASLWLAEKAVEFARAINKPFSIAESGFNAGVRNTSAGNYVKASLYLVEAEKIAEANDLQPTLMKVFNSLGNLYAMQQQQGTAIMYYKKAAKICEKLNRKSYEAVIVGNIGNIYYFKTEQDKRYLDSALMCFQKALAIQTIEKDTSRMIGMLNNIGLVYCDKEDYPAALTALDTASKLIELSHDRLDLLYNLQYRGRIEFEKENFDKAVEFYNKSLKISVEMNEVQFISENHFALSRAYEGLKDFENAYFHFKTYKELSDTLLNSENFEKIAGMQNKYEQEKEQ
ncbi:MAG: tetratricopeptide repeat protein, partial [Bacteroidia bacterium]|nr:tetratricopeptide repeat protein [Bacteroidia bacterium]